MKALASTLLASILNATIGALPLIAQPSTAINPATIPQTAPLTASEQRNLDLVLKWWLEVIEAHHTELAATYQTEDYIQHNPNVPTGRAAFIEVFSGIPPTNPMPDHLMQPPVVKGAKGNYVWLVFEHEARDPHDLSKTYRYNSFDILRIRNGKIQEHWDSAKRVSGSPDFVFSTAAPPFTFNTGQLTTQERDNIRLATAEFKNMLQYGHLELADKTMDPGYIQHNPNVPQGRQGFKQFMGSLLAGNPQAIKPEWKFAPVLTLANGPYVLMMWDVPDKDPSDPAKPYRWNHFDLLRIEGGLTKEHWDEAKIERKKSSVEANLLSAYAGNYIFTTKDSLALAVEDGHMVLQEPGAPKRTLAAESNTTFFLENTDAAIEFVKNADGKVTGLILHQAQQDVQATRQ